MLAEGESAISPLVVEVGDMPPGRPAPAWLSGSGREGALPAVASAPVELVVWRRVIGRD